ncbi:serine/threonine-protein phosphatase 6 regulatory ankyrin repeat subunit B-like isoform X2 [Oscarella lobularis]|uniref:serine/threonine-protein phosphatase 6 regulatory ankyrin repeat subunit B-like isoform X2 n=1 Tax=Oscarella lobularis TaxID=121494 RepID=UPI00331374E2
MNPKGFLAAVTNGNMAKVRGYVSKEPIKWKTIVNENGSYAIALAIWKKYLKILKYFLSMGWDIESRVDKAGNMGFLYAANKGFVKGVDLFVERGCNIEAKNDNGDGALALACLGGHLEMVKKLIEMGLSVNETHQYDSISLHSACNLGDHVAIATSLIENGANIEAENKLRQTPFLLACICQRVGVVDLLISKGCNIYAKDKLGDGALALASLNGNVKLAEKLIQLGLDVNEAHQDGYTSLHWTCDKGHLELAEFLIQNGAKLEIESKFGHTPFLVACDCECVGVADLLISKGCNIYAKTKRGDGALALASWRGNVKLAEKLIQLGLDVNEAQVFGYSSLHLACRHGHLELAEFLIRNGANLEVEDEEGRTPILCSAVSGNVNLLDMLISKGCDVQAKNKRGRGVLGMASGYGRVEMVKKLLEMEFSLFETDYFGRTSLHWAAKYNEKEVAEVLIERGANVEAQDKWGRTPFLHAVHYGHNEFADFLLSKDCNRHAIDHEGHGALALACIAKHRETAEWLLSKFSDQDVNSVLHLAAQSDDDRIVSLLFSNGADIEVHDEWGCTPLVTAIEFDSDNVIDLLLKEGCNMYAKTNKGECVLDVAIMGGRLDLFHRFVKAGIKATQLSSETRRFLQEAAASESEEAIQCLKEINVVQVSEDPLNWASPQEREEMQQEIDRLKRGSSFTRSSESEDRSSVSSQENKLRQRLDETTQALSRKEEELARSEDRAKEKEADLEALNANLRSEAEEEKKKALDANDRELAQLRAAAKEKDVQIENSRKEIDTFRLNHKAQLKEKDVQIENSRKDIHSVQQNHRAQLKEKDDQIEALRLDHENLRERYDETVAELRIVAAAKAEKDQQLAKAKEQENLLQIPIADVTMTEIKLGGGSFAEVKVGYWRGCAVAVKMFYELLNTERYLRLFQQEIAVCTRARHPNIVSLCGVTTENGVPLRIITELLEGSLSDVIEAALRSKWPLSLREQIDLALGMTAGIAYLHRLGGRGGVLHGDIRSTNVVVTSLMEAKICDLGAARFAEVSLSVGPMSADYLAPERNPENPNHQHNSKMADVYSLGVSVVELMTGEKPVPSHRIEQASSVGHPVVKRMCHDMISVDSSARPRAHECLARLERVQKSDEYEECYPKRMVKGKLHGEDRVSLVFPHCTQRRSVHS